MRSSFMIGGTTPLLTLLINLDDAVTSEPVSEPATGDDISKRPAA